MGYVAVWVKVGWRKAVHLYQTGEIQMVE